MSMADASFQERLARINAGQAHVAEGLLGNGELHKIRQRQEKGKAPKPVATVGIQEKKKFPLKRVIIAFFLGILSYFGGSLGAFHATQSVPSEFDQYRPLVEALGPAGMSGLLALFLLYVTGFRSVWLVGAIVTGFFAMHFTEPQMAAKAPELWTQMYSADHADALKFQALSDMAQIRSRLGLAPPAELIAEPVAEAPAE